MTQELKLQMDDSLPLRDVVFNTLRSAILGGELLPGERLMEIHLAQQLGVSRTPVREAIRKLELEGLVLTIPRKGALVAQITETDLQDVLEVRSALEELAVTKACRNMTPEQLTQLKEAAQVFEQKVRQGDLLGSAQADVTFHEIISSSTRNLRLIQLLGNIRSQIYRYRLENIKNRKSHADLIRQHDEIIEAISEKDEQKAVGAIRNHIDRQREAIIENLQA